MAGLDLADLDRSALQHRLAQHAEHEDDLGSLPDMLMFDGSMTEGMSSYAGMRKDGSVGTSGTDGDRTPDSISFRRGGGDKENQNKGSARALGKGEESSFITPMARKTFGNASPSTSTPPSTHRSFLVPLNDNSIQPRAQGTPSAFPSRTQAQSNQSSPSTPGVVGEASTASSSSAFSSGPISSTPVHVQTRPRQSSTGGPGDLSRSGLGSGGSTIADGLSVSTIKPILSARRVVRGSTNDHEEQRQGSTSPAQTPNLIDPVQTRRFISSLSRRNRGRSTIHATTAGSDEEDGSSVLDEKSLSIATIQRGSRAGSLGVGSEDGVEVEDSKELPVWDEGERSVDISHDSSSPVPRSNWVDTRKRYSKAHRPVSSSPEAQLRHVLPRIPSPVSLRDDASLSSAGQRQDYEEHGGESTREEAEDEQRVVRSTTPLGLPEGGRVPSLSRSMDGETSGSETGSWRATETPEPEERGGPSSSSSFPAGIVTPNRAAMRRSVSFGVGVTPGGLGVVDEEGESMEMDRDDGLDVSFGGLSGPSASARVSSSSRPSVRRAISQEDLTTPAGRKMADITGVTSSSQFTTPGAARHLSRQESLVDSRYHQDDDQDRDLRDEDSVEASLPELAQSRNSVAEMGTTPKAQVPRRLMSQSPAVSVAGEVEKSFMRDYVVTALEGSARKSTTTMQARRSLALSMSVARSRARSSLGSTTSGSGRDELIATPEMLQDETVASGMSFGFDQSLARSMNKGVLGPFHKRLVEARGNLTTSVMHHAESDESASNQSFVSIASSADLTSDKRGATSRWKGNTSLPGIGFDDIGTHEDRAQAPKLARHLHNMNEQLTAENQRLTEEMNALRGELQQAEWERDEREAQAESSRSVSSDRSKAESSFVRTTGLRNEQVIRLQEQVVELETALRNSQDEYKTFKHEAELKLAGAGSDDARVKDLEQELDMQHELAQEHEDEIEQLRIQLDEAVEANKNPTAENIHALENAADKERELLQRVQNLQWEKAAVEQEKERLRQVLESPDAEEKERSLQIQVVGLEREVQRLGEEIGKRGSKISGLEDDLDRTRAECSKRDQQLSARDDEVEDLRQELESERTKNDEIATGWTELEQTLKAEIEKLHQEHGDSRAELEKCYKEHEDYELALDDAAQLREELEDAKAQVDAISLEQQATITELEEQLAEARRETLDKAATVSDIQGKLDTVESALKASQATIASLEVELAGQSLSKASTTSSVERATSLRAREDAAIIESLKSRLAHAQSEVLDLQRAKFDSNPAHETALTARDAKINALAVEKQELQQEIRLLQTRGSDLNATPRPMRTGSSVTGSPAPRSIFFSKHLAHIKTPGTPMTPGAMPEYSFLNQSTSGQDMEMSMVERCQELQAELHEAQKRFDGNFERLERANLTTFQMADRLAEETERVVYFEKQVLEHRKRLEMVTERLEQVKCPDCEVRFDASELANLNRSETSILDLTPKPKQRQRNELQETLTSLRSQYNVLQEQVRVDRQRVRDQEQEIGRLQRDSRLAEQSASATLRQAEAEHDRESATLRREKQSLTTEKKLLQTKLERTETQLRETQTQVRKVQQQLREMRTQSQESQQRMSNLETEHESAKEDLSRISRRLVEMEQANSRNSAEAQARAVKEKEELLASKSRLEKDCLRLTESLRLKQKERDLLSVQLSETAKDLKSAESKLSSRSDNSAELRQDLRQVEAALAQHKREAEKFGQAVEVLQSQSEKQIADAVEVETLRGERESADRMISSLELELREVESRLEAKERELLQRLELSDEAQTEGLRSRIADLTGDRKKLTAQVRYMRAKFARENTFRSGLVVQKHYLLRLVGQFRQTERETLALIASMGYPCAKPEPPAHRSFKSVAIAVRSVIRMKRAAASWTNEVAQRDQMLKSHQSAKQQRTRTISLE